MSASLSVQLPNTTVHLQSIFLELRCEDHDVRFDPKCSMLCHASRDLLTHSHSLRPCDNVSCDPVSRIEILFLTLVRLFSFSCQFIEPVGIGPLRRSNQNMCLRGTCPKCKGASWWGCGHHVGQVLDSIDEKNRYASLINHIFLSRNDHGLVQRYIRACLISFCVATERRLSMLTAT